MRIEEYRGREYWVCDECDIEVEHCQCRAQGSAPSPLSLGEPFRLLSQENQ